MRLSGLKESRARLCTLLLIGGHEEAARALLMSDGFPTTAVNITNRWGHTALHVAALAGHCTVARMLLQSPRLECVNSMDLMGNSALHTAAVHGQADVVQLLLSSPAFTESDAANHQGQNALHLAAMKGHAAVVRTLDREGPVDGRGGGSDSGCSRFGLVWIVLSFPRARQSQSKSSLLA